VKITRTLDTELAWPGLGRRYGKKLTANETETRIAYWAPWDGKRHYVRKVLGPK
jgi:hypothetical protein